MGLQARGSPELEHGVQKHGENTRCNPTHMVHNLRLFMTPTVAKNQEQTGTIYKQTYTVDCALWMDTRSGAKETQAFVLFGFPCGGGRVAC